ncbi:MAG: type II secretion system protein M [Gammaproteobacteria bacterium]|nr:type II secretion system protein M [Gammaproteobacteria bacterium]
MKKWLANQSPRERRFVLTGGALLLGVMIYVMVIEPLSEAIEATSEGVVSQQKLLSELQQITAEYKSQKKAAPQSKQVTKQSLLAVIDQSAEKEGVKPAIKRLTPDGQTKVRVRLEGAKFDNLMSWLNHLSATYSIQANRVTLRGVGTEGIVNGNVELGSF